MNLVGIVDVVKAFGEHPESLVLYIITLGVTLYALYKITDWIIHHVVQYRLFYYLGIFVVVAILFGACVGLVSGHHLDVNHPLPTPSP